jgi:molybdopterin converting factor small subunit
MKVRLGLFAVAKDLLGASSIEVEVPVGATVGDLRKVVAELGPGLAPVAKSSMYAIGIQYVADDFTLKEGDEVACIPPVSGG